MYQQNGFIDQHIGGYRIVTEIGRGAFGSVFTGEHIIFKDRPVVAIKILHANFASKKERDQFLKEAESLEKLKDQDRHHILQIIDAGIQNNILYIITEYAPNGNLRNKMEDRVSLTKAMSIIGQIGDALSHAHAHNLVHRDIKPENILFDKDDNALLADFGITLELSGGRTASGQGIGGSLPYMAPEQFRGEVSLRSDQYALGCIAYELITGRRPIEVSIDDSASVEMKIAAWTQAFATDYKIRPLRIKTGSLDLSVEHEAAILKAIAKDRKDRHQSIDAFLKALDIKLTHKLDIILDQATLLKEQGDSYRKNKDYERALDAYNASIRMYPADAKIYNRKGLVLRELKRYSEALQAYEEAFKNASSDKTDFLYSNMGDVLSDMGDYEDALRAYNEAIRLSPTQPIFYVYKGNALRAMRDFKGAISIYEIAIHYATFTSNKKVSALAYGGKGEALTGLRRFSEAIEAYAKAIQFEPTNSSWYLAKGNTHWKCRQNEQACHAYREGLKFDPANTELLERLKITCK